MQLYCLSNKINRLSWFLGLLVLALCLCQPAFSSELEDFEQDLTKENAGKEAKPWWWEDEDDEDEEDESFWDGMFGLIFGSAAYGGINSWARVNPAAMEMDALPPRALGDALIPFFRFDAGYQNVEADVEAYDARAEAGYGPFGGQLRWTQYKEQTPSDELKIIQVHGLYRMSFGEHVEVDLGFGATTIEGEDRNTGFSFTAPILIYPHKFLGIEFRPSWSTIKNNPLDDYDVSLVLSYAYVSLRAGYRWLRSENESLDGPYIGFSLKL